MNSSYYFPNRKPKALLTGGSRGIGLSIKSKLEDIGVDVVTPSRAELDLASTPSIEKFIKASSLDFDILINNAGVNFIKSIEDVVPRELEMMFQTNVYAPIRLTQACLPHMKNQRWGRIVNLGSIFGLLSRAGRSQYTSTKSALMGFTKTLAIEYSQFDVLSNTVCPGYVATDLTRQNNSPEMIATIEKSLPIGRLAQPEEISELIAFLVSEKNTYLTGQSILVDGGFSIQ